MADVIRVRCVPNFVMPIHGIAHIHVLFTVAPPDIHHPMAEHGIRFLQIAMLIPNIGPVKKFVQNTG